MPKTNAPKRPASLPCDVHHLTVQRHPFAVVVGLLGGNPYEVFAFLNHSCPRRLSPSVHSGFSLKRKRGAYDLLDQAGTNLLADGLGLAGQLGDTEDALARMVSTSLRHGADVSFVVHQLEKTKGDLQSFSKAIARTLKKYVKDGTKVSGEVCSSCGTDALVRQEGCITCRSCGWSKC